jgi:ADP-heptose:LPS heptosyltransferase
MNILVIRLSSMGDVILTTPVLTWLTQAYPLCRIVMVTDKRYTSLFCNDPRIAQVIGVSKKIPLAHQLSELKNQAWDKIIDLQNNKRSAELRSLIGGVIAASVFHKNHIRRFLLLFFRMNRYTSENNVVRRYLLAAGAPEALECPTVQIHCNKNQTVILLQRYFVDTGSKPILALFPFSAWKNKEWFSDRYVAVGRAFTAMGWNIAILGGPEDTEHADELSRQIGPGAVSVAGRITLYDCACLLQGCTLALGNDTGLSHLARACGVKTGMVFGATTHHFGFFPTGKPEFRIFEDNIFCRPCHPHGGNFCWRFTRPCLSRIQSQNVIAGLLELQNKE